MFRAQAWRGKATYSYNRHALTRDAQVTPIAAKQHQASMAGVLLLQHCLKVRACAFTVNIRTLSSCRWLTLAIAVLLFSSASAQPVQLPEKWWAPATAFTCIIAGMPIPGWSSTSDGCRAAEAATLAAALLRSHILS